MSADEAFLWTVVLGASALLFLPHFNADTLVPRREYGVHEDAKRINNCVHTYVGRRELAFCFVKTFAAQLFILYSPSRVHRIISYASWLLEGNLLLAWATLVVPSVALAFALVYIGLKIFVSLRNRGLLPACCRKRRHSRPNRTGHTGHASHDTRLTHRGRPTTTPSPPLGLGLGLGSGGPTTTTTPPPLTVEVPSSKDSRPQQPFAFAYAISGHVVIALNLLGIFFLQLEGGMRNKCALTIALSQLVLMANMALYAVAAYKGPGFIQAGDYTEAGQDTRWCPHSGFWVPMNSKYCRRCGHSVAGFDHHCEFLHQCVGRDNYSWFFATVFTAAVYNTLALKTFNTLVLGPQPWNDFQDVRTGRLLTDWTACAGYFSSAPVYVTAHYYISVSAVALDLFALWHVVLICIGRTTYSMIQYSRSRGKKKEDSL